MKVKGDNDEFRLMNGTISRAEACIIERYFASMLRLMAIFSAQLDVNVFEHFCIHKIPLVNNNFLPKMLSLTLIDR